MSNQIDIAALSRYQPLNALNPENLQQALRQLTTEGITAGETLFNKGDTDNYQYYLVDGEIDLLGDAGVLKTIKANTPDSINAIAHILPRTITAKAKTNAVIFKIDGNLVDVMLTWDQTGNYQVTELGVGSGNGDDDWMNRSVS
jgi:CRP-like cAMP-binding protein